MQTVFQALIFDMDGTLTVPVLDFELIRKELGIPPGEDLVSALNARDEPARRQGWAIIEQHEAAAQKNILLQDGVVDCLARCREAGIQTGILTRNTSLAVDALCRILDHEFEPVVTREFPFLKPRPEPVLHILKHWDCPAANVLTIGDYIHDLAAGRAAGTETCYFFNPGAADFAEFADYTVHNYEELNEIIFGK